MADAVELANRYVLARELKKSSEAAVFSMAKLFRLWANGRDFNSTTLSEFLRAKQDEGCSAYYRLSLRSTLSALLRFNGDNGPVRSVKRTRLEPKTWVAADVRKIIEAIPEVIPEERIEWWTSLVTAAWYTGLSWCDLVALDASQVDAEGTVTTRRAKTGNSVVAWMPPDIAKGKTGKLWPLYCKREWFRLTWQQIVGKAGLSGPFKKLRKSSGTSVEELNPGQGHLHLANGRLVFQRHYLGEVKRKALIPERL